VDAAETTQEDDVKSKAILAIAVLGVMLTATAAATAATIGSSLSGGAVAEQSDVRLTSDLTDAGTTNDASAITFTLPAGTTFADITSLSTEFNPVAGSPASGATTPLGCGGGSPRFSITLSSGKNVFVYLGPSPNFNSCALNTWQSSGNLIGNNDAGRYDTSQVQAGTQSSNYAAALALVGSQPVTSISLVADAGWAFTPKVQTVLVRNVQINGQTFYAPTTGTKTNPAKLCKAELATLGRTAFEQKYGKNHNLRNAFGKCVSSMAHQHHASASTSHGHGHDHGHGKGHH
jgi:hypothetical protein